MRDDSNHSKRDQTNKKRPDPFCPLRLSKSDGSMYASSYYLDTILKHHDQVQIYKSQSGRAPAIIRYDIKSGGGVFCLVASVDSYGNPKYDSDVQDLSASLKTFVPVQGRDK
jgi:hypothetical protein